MENPNIKPSDRAPAAAFINPVSQGAGTVTSGWVSMQTADSLLADVICGVLGAAATVDAKLQQATDAAGTGAKDITGKAITQLVKATDDNKTARINLRSEELDVAGGFGFVRLSITVGAAASLIAGMIQAFDARYAPLAQAAAVKQVVA